MIMNDKIANLVYIFIDTVFSVIRLILKTRFKKTIPFQKTSNQCLIMGNGPSLIESLENNKNKLPGLDLVAVNFMALSEEYTKYKPNIYILCDPAFWFDTTSEDTKIKVKNFYSQISQKTNWELQLSMPYQALKKKEIKEALSHNPNIRIHYYNNIKFEGYNFLSYRVYNKQWGMPRAENVVVAALMLAVYSGYKKIYIAGADSDYIKNAWVDEENNLRFNDYHYYKDSKKNIATILQIKIHELCISSYYMFKSYIDIEKYAVYRKTKIYNTGLNSFIDAFEKKNLII